MTEVTEPPEGLRMAAYRAARYWATEHGHQQPDDRMVDAVVAALFGACEVREEHRIVIDDERMTGLWLPTMLAYDALCLAAMYASGRVERRLVLETQPESVCSAGEDAAGGR